VKGIEKKGFAGGIVAGIDHIDFPDDLQAGRFHRRLLPEKQPGDADFIAPDLVARGGGALLGGIPRCGGRGYPCQILPAGPPAGNHHPVRRGVAGHTEHQGQCGKKEGEYPAHDHGGAKITKISSFAPSSEVAAFLLLRRE